MNSKALHSISYGLYIVSSMDGERINGQIANSLFQVTSEPQTIAVSINKENLTHSYIQTSRIFSVSILSQETPSTLIGRFGFRSGRNIDKFDGIKHKRGITGTPIALDYAIAYIEVDVIDEMDCGTHTIFFGKVVEAEVLSSDEPLTYAYYQKVKKGKSPKTAPTYQKDEPPSKVEKAPCWVCTLCGYVYDPDKGDPDHGIPPGRNFEDLPEDWTCPVCGAAKSEFEKEKS